MLSGKIMKRLTKNNTGSVLIMTLILSMATIALGVAYLNFVDHHRQKLSYDIMRYKGWAAAHAAMVRGMLLHTTPGVEYVEPLQDYYVDDGEIYIVNNYFTAGSRGRDYYNYSQLTHYLIEGKSEVKFIGFDYVDEFAVAHDMSSRSYADWLYITDRETQAYRPPADAILRFWGGDTLDGKVHSNDKIHFESRLGEWPVFYERVTTCSTRFDPSNAHQYVHFYGGYETSYQYFPFPLQADSVRANNGYPDLEPPGPLSEWVTEITLQPENFIIRWRQQDEFAGSRNRTYFYASGDSNVYSHTLENAPRLPYPPSKALFIEGELWLTAAKGQRHFNYRPNDGGDAWSEILDGFNGELTIGASGDIVIAQNILYAGSNSDGTVPITCDDYLGIISERHILFWRGCSNILRVNAGLGAIGFNMGDVDSIPANKCPPISTIMFPPDGRYGTISVDGINCYNWENEKYQLFIQGCLIQRERGLIHSHYNSGWPITYRGFESKDYKYDKRFISHPPPHFFETKSPDNAYREHEEPYWW